LPERFDRTHLAAVLAADAAGYTRLMHADPAATVAALDAAREAFRREIERADGHVVDMAGDSVLATFSSALAAVEAALAVQHRLNAAGAEKAPGPRLEFRIGVHLGDLIRKDDGSVYGDGVNIAARLQTLAGPGGVCISDTVAEQVGRSAGETFDDIGIHALKNVERPVRVFAWGPRASAAETAERAGPGISAKPRVALAAFRSTGGTDADELAHGVADGVATALANQTGIEVVADEAGATFVVYVTIQVAGGRYRAALRILDRASDDYFGADRFDGTLEDPFSAQDGLAYRIYNAVRFALHDREMRDVQHKADAPGATENELLLEAGSLMFTGNLANYRRAGAILQRLAAGKPDDFMVQAMLANALLAEVIAGFRAISAADAAAAREAVRRAKRLRDTSDYVHFVASEVALFADRNHDSARREAERSLELNPYYAFATTLLGATAIFSGAAEEGIAHCRKVLDSEPRLQFAGLVLEFGAIGYFALGDYSNAIEWARRSDQRTADVPRTLTTLAAAAAAVGDAETARAAAERLMMVCPDFTLAEFGSWPFRDPSISARLVEALTLAGLE